MSWFKFFVVCALLLCLMEPCLVEAQGEVHGGEKNSVRFKRGDENWEADHRNTRDKMSLSSMLEKHRGPNRYRYGPSYGPIGGYLKTQHSNKGAFSRHSVTRFAPNCLLDTLVL
ncbi:uncharacterized protein LOC144644022 [Oculina patagonica]